MARAVNLQIYGSRVLRHKVWPMCDGKLAVSWLCPHLPGRFLIPIRIYPRGTLHFLASRKVVTSPETVNQGNFCLNSKEASLNRWLSFLLRTTHTHIRTCVYIYIYSMSLRNSTNLDLSLISLIAVIGRARNLADTMPTVVHSCTGVWSALQ